MPRGRQRRGRVKKGRQQREPPPTLPASQQARAANAVRKQKAQNVALQDARLTVPRRTIDGSTAAYVSALTNPFYSPQPKLGWGCFTPTSILTGYEQNGFVRNSAAGLNNWAVWGPVNAGATTQHFSSNTLSTNPLSANQSDFGYANNSTIAAMAGTGRIISGALRVNVRYPTNSLPGIAVALYLPKVTYAAVAASTYDTLYNMSSARVLTGNSAGNVGGEVQYRPSDSNDFAMTQSALTPGGTDTVDFLMVLGYGWSDTTGYAVDWEWIGHFETLAGATDSAQMDGGTVDSLAVKGVSMDQAVSALNDHPPIIDNLDALELMSQGLSHAQRMARGNWRGNLAAATAAMTARDVPRAAAGVPTPEEFVDIGPSSVPPRGGFRK